MKHDDDPLMGHRISISQNASMVKVLSNFSQIPQTKVDREFWPRKDYYKGFGAFVNLKWIHIHPLTDGLYDFLFRITIKLKRTTSNGNTE